jgi:dihydropteroate synthase
MGVVNVTPDSFSDAGAFFHTDLAVEHALKLLDEGADILDIGGESTRPGTQDAVDALEESRRVIPVIKGVLRERPDAVISIDTYKAETARRAIDAGVEILNDVSGMTWDPAMLDAATDLACGCVLMHSRGRPHEWRSLPKLSREEVVPVVSHGLSGLSERALLSGIARERIALDPGFGFGKRFDENYPLLAGVAQIAALGFPVVAGVSRKSFLARTVAQRRSLEDLPMSERATATTAANVACVLNGAHILRVHDVQPAVEAAAIADAILAAEPAT